MALISHIQASELAFENGNRKFLISKSLDFPDKKKRLILDGVFSRDGPDIRFSIRYPANSGHFSAIRIPDIRFLNIRPDIRQTGYY